MQLAKLQEFRQAAYNHLDKAKDATFELTDAVLLIRNVYSLADLSLCLALLLHSYKGRLLNLVKLGLS